MPGLGTSLLLALFAALAYRTVRASYPRRTREAFVRGTFAAAGAVLGGFAASHGAQALTGAPTTVDAQGVALLVSVTAMVGAALACGVVALVALLALEDAGVRVPA